MDYIRELRNYGPYTEEEEAVCREYLTDARLMVVKKAIESFVDDEFSRLGEYATEFISGVATSRAESFLRRVLDGDENAARQLLGCSGDGSRYRQGGSEDGKPWACVHCTWVFETDGIRLRREIVDAFPELLKNERIKDLESVVEGLRRQVVELQNRLDYVDRC